MQTSLNLFDPSKKKETWKVIFKEDQITRIVYEQAFSQDELEDKYRDAIKIIKIGRGQGGGKNAY